MYIASFVYYRTVIIAEKIKHKDFLKAPTFTPKISAFELSFLE